MVDAQGFRSEGSSRCPGAEKQRPGLGTRQVADSKTKINLQPLVFAKADTGYDAGVISGVS